MKSNVRIRDYVKTDAEYEALSKLHNTIFPEDPTSAGEIRAEDEHIDETKYVCRRLIAEDKSTGELIGQMEFDHVPTRYHPQRFRMWLEVHPKYQNRGIGAALYDKAIEELKPHDPIAFQSAARETRTEAIKFLEKRGFREVSRTFESHLDLTQFEMPLDLPEFDSGLSFTTLAEEKSANPNWLPELHQLYSELGHDVPSTDAYTPISLEEFQKRAENPLVIDEAYFLIKDGSAFSGVSYVHRVEGQPTHLIQEFTGVRKPYRRRGLALALKYNVLGYAIANGFEKVRTWNDTTNQGMIAINDRLGFVKKPAWIKFELDLAMKASTSNRASRRRPSR